MNNKTIEVIRIKTHQELKLKKLLISLIVLNTADSVVTHFLVELNLARELNPVLASLVGEPTFFIFKAVGVIYCALMLWRLYQKYPRVVLTTTSVLCVSYAAIVLWNSSHFIL